MREVFKKLYGNSAVKKRILKAIETNTLSHAFLVVGESGSGKKTLAKEISAALNCERKDNGAYPLPCNSCNSCRRIYDGNFTDITYLERGEKATIGVDEIRLIKDDMLLSATESKYKIYVIPEAEKMTPNAQNALLKVLEEPPSNTHILLLANGEDKLLTTIKSRTQLIRMERFSEEQLNAYLTETADRARSLSRTDPETLRGIIMSADGKIGAALSLLDEKSAAENREDRQIALDIVHALKNGTPYSALYSALAELPSDRLRFTEALESLICAVRDMICAKSSNAPCVFFTNREDAIEAGRGITTKRLLLIYDIFKDALLDNSKNVSISTVTVDLGAKIKMAQ